MGAVPKVNIDLATERDRESEGGRNDRMWSSGKSYVTNTGNKENGKNAATEQGKQ